MIDPQTNFLSSGWACVSMFFIISGYVITPARPNKPNNAPFGSAYWIRHTTRMLFSMSMAVLSDILARWMLGFLSSLGHLLASSSPQFGKTQPLWLDGTCALRTIPVIFGGKQERLCQGL